MTTGNRLTGKMMIPTNWDPALLPKLRKFQPKYVYGSLPSEATLRNSANLPSVTEEMIEDQVALMNEMGIGFIYVMNATTGPNNGVLGQTNSTAGRGVYGLATTTTGQTYGVFGQSNSSTGTGVAGTTTSGTPGANIPQEKLTTELPGIAWDLLPMKNYRAHNWHSFGHIRLHMPSSSTRFINRSGTQRAVNKSRARTSSLP